MAAVLIRTQKHRRGSCEDQEKGESRDGNAADMNQRALKAIRSWKRQRRIPPRGMTQLIL